LRSGASRPLLNVSAGWPTTGGAPPDESGPRARRHLDGRRMSSVRGSDPRGSRAGTAPAETPRDDPSRRPRYPTRIGVSRPSPRLNRSHERGAKDRRHSMAPPRWRAGRASGHRTVTPSLAAIATRIAPGQARALNVERLPRRRARRQTPDRLDHRGQAQILTTSSRPHSTAHHTGAAQRLLSQVAERGRRGRRAETTLNGPDREGQTGARADRFRQRGLGRLRRPYSVAGRSGDDSQVGREPIAILRGRPTRAVGT
jgi:hypothetical protein